MRARILSIVLVCTIAGPALAQGKLQPRPPAPPSDINSDQKAAEVKRAIEIGQGRQREVDARNSRIWRRWDYAVCVGCGPMPRRFRIVYTTPARVLAGFIAADDDEARIRGRQTFAARLF
ncbi:hypothetical protein [Methylobacterium oxalidis]|uniref:Uncharacterized protein n=1 Tax=Methylobacterium oxalidis TaxID=944322 RepID=A0A512J3B3_9HYPH|nr:hypothetical protein [Methylobacterium oxalidis]GEP04444.1 hypothetical protein MOX02_24820 [Methylobacterium oxalidis]GJE34641.1 hypothetical protein LDDCCGHA_4853 [Methylobacterium oxalidis]GLS62816.1 hypothetical protein GCM10007888_11970 [Methylobacterium oxalidis]